MRRASLLATMRAAVLFSGVVFDERDDFAKPGTAARDP